MLCTFRPPGSHLVCLSWTSFTGWISITLLTPFWNAPSLCHSKSCLQTDSPAGSYAQLIANSLHYSAKHIKEVLSLDICPGLLGVHVAQFMLEKHASPGVSPWLGKEEPWQDCNHLSKVYSLLSHAQSHSLCRLGAS